ncbi:Gustatory receptor 78a [Halyomorpha halys]|nr:Gustatory receptor 78a [Halyomorpha halys]
MQSTKCLKKAFMIPRIAGLCPLSFDGDFPQIDYLLLPYSIFVISLFGFQSIWCLIQTLYFAIDIVIIITSNVMIVLYYCNIVSSYLYLVFARDSLTSIFLYFTEVDVYFSKLGKKAIYEINLFYDFILISFGSIVFFYEYTQQWKYIFKMVEVITFHYLVLSTFVCVNPFIKMLYLIKHRFKMLNSTFVELKSYQFSQSEVLEVILKLHDILSRACENLNKFFSSQLLFAVCICFFNVSIGAYFIITGVRKMHLIHTFCETSALLFQVILIGLLANVCKTTSDEANQLHILLSERLWNEDTRKIKNIGKVEAYLLMKRRVEFKVYGFLVLDHTLLLSILGAGTTYLVILLQVGSKSSLNASGSGPNYNVTTAVSS